MARKTDEAVLQTLVGGCITEVGERQAWPFVQIIEPSGGFTQREYRLYIDTDYWVTDDPDAYADHEWSPTRLASLLNLTIQAVRAENRLEILFHNGARLHVSETPNATTTGDIWWLGRL